jgi:hypothetical protein
MRYLGQHLWGRGYFCLVLATVTKQQIKKYIENQQILSVDLRFGMKVNLSKVIHPNNLDGFSC